MRTLLNLFAFCAVMFLLCACSSFEVTRDVDQALSHVEDNLVYHNRAYMKKQPLKVPNGVDEKKFGELKFNFAFKQGTEIEDGKSKNLDWNYFSKNEWNAFQREFENAITATKRFPVAQMLYGLSDSDLRKKTNNGVANTKELDPSALKEATAIFHITPLKTYSFSLAKREKINNYTLKLTINPLSAEDNSPLESVQPFSIQVNSVINQKTDNFGRPVQGFRFATRKMIEDFNIKLCRASIVQFFNKMYNIFPSGGEVVNYEEGQFVLKASRSTGLQPNMEFVVYAMKKGDPDAVRIALYNATADSVGQTGNSTLTVWRKSEKKNAKKIIKMIEDDFSEAKEEYDFYACSDGFAEWPDFIERSTKKGDK